MYLRINIKQSGLRSIQVNSYQPIRNLNRRMRHALQRDIEDKLSTSKHKSIA